MSGLSSATDVSFATTDEDWVVAPGRSSAPGTAAGNSDRGVRKTMEPNRASDCLGIVERESLAAQDPATDPDEEEFLRDVWPGLVRLGRLLSGSRQRGEDLAQEAIIGLLRNAPVAEPRAYLRRSIVNLSINDNRRAARERLHLSTLREDVIPPPEVDDLWPLVRALPPRQRAVLVLRYYEDLSEADIARVMECRPGTVKSLASRALVRLRRELES